MSKNVLLPSIESRNAIKYVLVGLSAGKESPIPALDIAIALARECWASLSFYVFAPSLHHPLPISAITASAWLEEEKERLENLTLSAMRSATEAISRAGIAFAAEHTGSPFESRTARFLQLARVHDITVLDAADHSETTERMVIEDVLFDSGRPMVLVPPQGGQPCPRRIVIAWDGSARSARAVKDALPFLVGAEAVIAVTVTDEKDLSHKATGAELVAYLERHRVECKLATLAAQQQDVAERLRLFAAEEEIDMIVMGAFVHSRFRQAILGGVTRSLLDQPPVQLFLSH